MPLSRVRICTLVAGKEQRFADGCGGGMRAGERDEDVLQENMPGMIELCESR